ncbi:MAG TPA: MerR family transcriptional regulator [Bacilli bacterium]|nr:MerR family transcriptional regulator [Bacilli bacterium]
MQDIDLYQLFDLDFLLKLKIGIGETSEVTGIPQRQLRYWEDKGIIVSSSGERNVRRYDYLNVKKILLIKELLDEGYTLDRAAEKVSARMTYLNESFRKLQHLNTSGDI